MKSHAHVFVLLLAVVSLLVSIPACKVGGSSPLSGGLPVFAALELVDTNGRSVALARTDGDTWIVQSAVRGRLRLVDKASGITVAVLDIAGEHEVWCGRRTKDVKEKLAAGAALPMYLRDAQLFAPGEAEALGFTFATDAAETPAP